MVDLHQLINEPGYGQASKALQAAGLWTVDDTERIDWLDKNTVTVADINGEPLFSQVSGDWNYGGIRYYIDAAMSHCCMEHKE